MTKQDESGRAFVQRRGEAAISLSPHDEAVLRIGREHDRRQARDCAERDLVRNGWMKLTWTDWGLRNGYDDNVVPMLKLALRRRKGIR
jgi:hypothetical protein